MEWTLSYANFNTNVSYKKLRLKTYLANNHKYPFSDKSKANLYQMITILNNFVERYKRKSKFQPHSNQNVP